MNDLYTVVEHNQASHQPVDDQTVFCWSLREAAEEQERLTDINRQRGRRERYVIYRLEEVDESELYEWAIQEDRRTDLHVCRSEYDARQNRPGGWTVLRRRLGTTEWTTAPEEGI